MSDWPTVSEDVAAYQAKDLMGRLADRGPVMKRVPVAVVETIVDAQAENARLRTALEILATSKWSGVAELARMALKGGE